MKFIADRTLGKLSRRLRALGFDVLYWGGGNVEEASRAASAGDRILLTRSRRIKEKAGEPRVLIVEANEPREQLAELRVKLDLHPRSDQFFSRCLLCNEEIQAIPKDEAEGRVPDFVYRLYDSFHICPRCRRIYWPGTHYERMKKELSKTITDKEDPPEEKGSR
jgi:uncharacterized protein